MCLSYGPGHHPGREFLADLLARASHTLVQGFAEELRGRGTSLPVWRVMAALLASPGATVGDLAAVCLLQQPTMTKLLDRMARDGLVTRAQDARDRRVVRVALTPEGRAKAAELVAVAESYEAEVLARHPQAEGTKDVLRGIIARFGPAPQDAGGGEEDVAGGDAHPGSGTPSSAPVRSGGPSGPAPAPSSGGGSAAS
jgi:MarR family transcriptional regulator, organic hydroperoxide resistance regulator